MCTILRNGFVFGLLTLFYWPTLFNLFHSRWDYIDYTHAYFMLPVSLILVWTRRHELAKAASSGRPLSEDLYFFGIFAFGLAAAIFAWRESYIFLTTLALLPILYGLSGFLYGNGVTKILSFPILYLLFMVPPPLGILDSITLPMRYGVSVATEKTLSLFNYPITREGLLLFIGGKEVYLGEACSGFRSLITLSSLGAAYIYLLKTGSRKKWLIATSIIPLALIGNFLRVVSVVLATHYLGVTQAQQYYHDFSGFGVFLFMVLGLLWIEKKVRD